MKDRSEPNASYMDRLFSPTTLLCFLHPALLDIYVEADKRWVERYYSLPKPFITCAYRENWKQEKLYEIGRTKPGKIVTNAKSGQSPHNYNPSFAFDIGFRTSDGGFDWSDNLFIKFASLISEIDISNIILWGGNFKNFKDIPHFEMDGWKNIILLNQP